MDDSTPFHPKPHLCTMSDTQHTSQDTSPKKKLRKDIKAKSEEAANTLPDFVLDAHATPKDAQELATERLYGLANDIFCAMAEVVRTKYNLSGFMMTCQFPHTYPNRVFNPAFKQAKEWMEALGWDVCRDGVGNICISD